MKVLHHFSEDPTIERFVPHVPPTNPSQPAAVWAIDAEHAPLYWFPRDCPRVTAWPTTNRAGFEAAWHSTAPRVHAVELSWIDRIRSTELYRYDFDATHFGPWPEASGQWTAEVTVEPLSVEALGDLVVEHVRAGIELRFVPSLWSLHDLAQAGDWDFSIVRMANAQPRPT